MGRRSERWDLAVDSPDDPAVVPFVGLRDRRLARLATPLLVAEGDTVVDRALGAGLTLRSLLVDRARSAVLSPPVVAARRAGATVLGASPEVVSSITGLTSHPGCLGLFERPQPRSIDDAIEGAITVVLTVSVQNPVNLGLIARNAIGMGAEALLVDHTSSDPYYRRATRVSMGEVFAVPHARIGDPLAGIAVLHRRGFRTLALTPATDASDLAECRIADADRVALVVGAEGPGLTPEVQEAATERVRLPLAHDVDSLNAGAAAAVAAYAVARARAEHRTGR